MVGASGFLGRHVVPELRARGHEVVSASRSGADGEALDVTDAGACADVVARVHPDVVLNLAGAGVTAGSAGEDEMARVNLDGPGNVAGFREVHQTQCGTQNVVARGPLVERLGKINIDHEFNSATCRHDDTAIQFQAALVSLAAGAGQVRLCP